MKKKWIPIVLLAGIVLLFALLVRQVLLVWRAHSTFANYYEFRGCVQLVKKTEDAGVCKLSSGKTITLVRFHDKWYLQGDLPVCTFGWCW